MNRKWLCSHAPQDTFAVMWGKLPVARWSWWWEGSWNGISSAVWLGIQGLTFACEIKRFLTLQKLGDFKLCFVLCFYMWGRSFTVCALWYSLSSLGGQNHKDFSLRVSRMPPEPRDDTQPSRSCWTHLSSGSILLADTVPPTALCLRLKKRRASALEAAKQGSGWRDGEAWGRCTGRSEGKSLSWRFPLRRDLPHHLPPQTKVSCPNAPKVLQVSVSWSHPVLQSLNKNRPKSPWNMGEIQLPPNLFQKQFSMARSGVFLRIDRFYRERLNFERVDFIFLLNKEYSRLSFQDCVEIKMCFGKNRLNFVVTN